MVVARVIVGCLFLAFIVVTILNSSYRAEITRLEKRWSQNIQNPTRERLENLRQTLISFGAQLSHEGDATLVVYNGPQDDFTSIVNKLIPENFEWTKWKCERISTNEVNGIICAKGL